MAAEKQDNSTTLEINKRLDEIFGEGGTETEEAEPEAFAGSPLEELRTAVYTLEWEITDEIMTTFLNEVERLKGEYEHDNVVLVFLRLLGSIGKYIKNKKANTHPAAIKLLNSLFTNLEKVIESGEMSKSEKRSLLMEEVEKFNKLKEQITQKKEKTEKSRSRGSGRGNGAGAAVGKKVDPELQISGQELPGNPPSPGTERDSEEPRIHADSSGDLHGRGQQNADNGQRAETGNPGGSHTGYEAFRQAVDELKQVMREEFQALRAEVRKLRK